MKFSLAPALLAVAIAASAVTPAVAQIGPALALRPWDRTPHLVDASADLRLVNRGHTDDDYGISLTHLESQGRIKPDREDADPPFGVGYDLAILHIASDHPALPGGMTDLAAGAGFRLGQIAPDWSLHLVGGVGVAGDDHFRESDALYGIANLQASWTIDPRKSLHVGLNYDGNRAIFPDLPLPYLTFQHRLSDSLFYALGLPASTLVWDPVESVTLEVHYIVPISLRGRVSWRFIPDWSVFAEFDRRVLAVDRHDDDRDRLFYQGNQAAAGVRWRPSPNFDLSLGGGYAFGQEFSTGWDLRDLDEIAEVSDEPLLFARLRVLF